MFDCENENTTKTEESHDAELVKRFTEAMREYRVTIPLVEYTHLIRAEITTEVKTEYEQKIKDLKAEVAEAKNSEDAAWRAVASKSTEIFRLNKKLEALGKTGESGDTAE